MKTQKNKAITLVALVITMVILIILAGVSINMLFGENGIITKAKLGKSKFLGEDAREVVEQRVAALKQESAQKGVDTTLYDFWFMYNSETLEDGSENKNFKDDMAIYLFTDEISAKFKPATKKVSRPADSIANCEANYSKLTEYKTSIVVYKDYVTTVNKDIIVSSGVMNIDADETVQSTLESAGINAGGNIPSTIKDKLENLGIAINNEISDTSISGNDGNITPPQTESQVTYKPSTNNSTSVNTCSYATIDVIWLAGDTNNISTKPNSPNYLPGMTKVSWEGVNGAEENSGYYNYVANYDSSNIYNPESKWANAKIENEYFVWIPRFAYRFTYYDSSNNIVGYYDGYGRWNENGISIELDPGIETVNYNNKKYIVHPAFMNDTNKTDKNNNPLPDYDRGGWDKNLTGFWVGKNIYGSCTSITNSYNICKNFCTSNNSHLIKTTEYGAVAYLMLSQYGIKYNYTHNTNINVPNNDYGIGYLINNTNTYNSGFELYEGHAFYDSSVSVSDKYNTRYYSDDYSDILGNGIIGDGSKEVYIYYSTYPWAFEGSPFWIIATIYPYLYRGESGILHANNWYKRNEDKAYSRIVLAN